MSVAELEAREIQLEAPSGLWSEAWHRIIRNPGAILGAAFVLTFVTVAVFAPLIAPYGPKEQNLNLLNAGKPVGPTHGHWFGVDLLGRDEFSRIVYGARYSLLIGVVSVAIGLSIGLVLGATAGYLGGLVDSTIMRGMDVMLAIPGLLFAIGIVAMLGPGLWQVMLAVGIVNIPIFARLLRGSVLAQRENDFVLAARSVGVRRRVILFSHILPNAISRPRICRRARSLCLIRSFPPKTARPVATRPLRASNPRTASEVTLFPQPDSPTIPSVSPAAIANEIPLTACTVPRRVENSTRRSSTARSGSGRIIRSGRSR